MDQTPSSTHADLQETPTPADASTQSRTPAEGEELPTEADIQKALERMEVAATTPEMNMHKQVAQASKVVRNVMLRVASDYGGMLVQAATPRVSYTWNDTIARAAAAQVNLKVGDVAFERASLADILDEKSARRAELAALYTHEHFDEAWVRASERIIAMMRKDAAEADPPYAFEAGSKLYDQMAHAFLVTQMHPNSVLKLDERGRNLQFASVPATADGGVDLCITVDQEAVESAEEMASACRVLLFGALPGILCALGDDRLARDATLHAAPPRVPVPPLGDYPLLTMQFHVAYFAAHATGEAQSMWRVYVRFVPVSALLAENTSLDALLVMEDVAHPQHATLVKEYLASRSITPLSPWPGARQRAKGGDKKAGTDTV